MRKRIACLFSAIAITLALCLALPPAGIAMENSAPVAENLELTTYRGVPVAGKMAAVDPEGDLLTYEVSTPPGKGELILQADGNFVYKPAEGKKGKDYFGYKAVDCNNNASQEATVIIRIEKQKTKISYADMEDSGSGYAALRLAERGIFTGQNLGGEYFFEPDRSVSRGEFLAMCLKLADAEVLSGVTRTGFVDDDTIPMWVKPYVSTALMSGVISGYANDPSGPVFDSRAPISYSEAAVVLNRLMDITDVSNVSSQFYETVPTWACQATANLSSCKILPSGISSMAGSISRADAASMLLGASKILDAR